MICCIYFTVLISAIAVGLLASPTVVTTSGVCPDENLWQFIQFVISCWLWLKSSRLAEEKSCIDWRLGRAAQLLAYKKSWHDNYRQGNTTKQYYEAEPSVHTTTPYEVLLLLRQHEYNKWWFRPDSRGTGPKRAPACPKWPRRKYQITLIMTLIWIIQIIWILIIIIIIMVMITIFMVTAVGGG